MGCHSWLVHIIDSGKKIKWVVGLDLSLFLICFNSILYFCLFSCVIHNLLWIVLMLTKWWKMSFGGKGVESLLQIKVSQSRLKVMGANEIQREYLITQNVKEMRLVACLISQWLESSFPLNHKVSYVLRSEKSCLLPACGKPKCYN